MKINFDQLLPHLEKNLAPLYWIAGAELLFVQETVQHIRAQAQAQGFTEHLVFTVDAKFDWEHFQQACQMRSLFGDKQCIELRLGATKWNEAGKKAVQFYSERLPADKLLLILTDKLDATTQKTAHFKAAEKAGVAVTIWPLQPHQVAPWISRRLQTHGLTIDSAAAQLLAARTQGNTLAAAQEIEKLALLYPPGKLTLEQVREASFDNARFDVFDLVDGILQGNAEAIMRIMQVLKAESTEPTLILWALTRELRQLLQLAQTIEQGQPIASALSGHKIWEKHKPNLTRLLRTHTRPTLESHLLQAATIDRQIKGAEPGSVWDALTQLALKIGISDN